MELTYNYVFVKSVKLTPQDHHQKVQLTLEFIAADAAPLAKLPSWLARVVLVPEVQLNEEGVS